MNNHLWRHKDQQFPFTDIFIAAAKQRAKQWQVAQQRHFVDRTGDAVLENAAKNHGFTIVNQHLSADTLGINRHRFTRTGFHHFTRPVLCHAKIEHQTVIRGDLRRDFQTQYRFFERNGSRATGGRFQIGNFGPLFDVGRLFIGGNQTRAGNDLRF